MKLVSVFSTVLLALPVSERELQYFKCRSEKYNDGEYLEVTGCLQNNKLARCFNRRYGLPAPSIRVERGPDDVDRFAATILGWYFYQDDSSVEWKDRKLVVKFDSDRQGDFSLKYDATGDPNSSFSELIPNFKDVVQNNIPVFRQYRPPSLNLVFCEIKEKEDVAN